MQYSKGKWLKMLFAGNLPAIMCQPDDTRLGQNMVARCEIASKPQAENEGNTDLIVSAVNACIKINPENPLAVAGTIEDMAEILPLARKELRAWMNSHGEDITTQAVINSINKVLSTIRE